MIGKEVSIPEIHIFFVPFHLYVICVFLAYLFLLRTRYLNLCGLALLIPINAPGVINPFEN